MLHDGDPCVFCHRPACKDQDINKVYNHVTCVGEYDRRVATGVCVCCGKNERIDSDRFDGWCRECLDNESDYSGYPGA